MRVKKRTAHKTSDSQSGLTKKTARQDRFIAMKGTFLSQAKTRAERGDPGCEVAGTGGAGARASAFTQRVGCFSVAVSMENPQGARRFGLNRCHDDEDGTKQKSRRGRTPLGIRPRRLTRQRAFQLDWHALHLVIRQPL